MFRKNNFLRLLLKVSTQTDRAVVTELPEAADISHVDTKCDRECNWNWWSWWRSCPGCTGWRCWQSHTHCRSVMRMDIRTQKRTDRPAGGGCGDSSRAASNSSCPRTLAPLLEGAAPSSTSSWWSECFHSCSQSCQRWVLGLCRSKVMPLPWPLSRRTHPD